MKTEEFDNKIENVTDSHSGAKIIDLNDYAEYNKKLSEIMETVNSLSYEIYEGLFPLAVLNKWKEWDAEQPTGSKLNVDEEMLRNTGDKNIDILWELLDKVEEVIERIGVCENHQDFPEDFNPFMVDYGDEEDDETEEKN